MLQNTQQVVAGIRTEIKLARMLRDSQNLMRKFGSIPVHGKSNGKEVLGFKKKIAALEQLQRLLKIQVDGNFLEYQIGIGGLKGKVQR